MFSKVEMKNMESWRGLVAFLVFIGHGFQIFFNPIWGPDHIVPKLFGTMGNLCVVIFFLLSGLAITFSALNLNKNGSFEWKNYLINRFTRIYPPFVFVLILMLLMLVVAKCSFGYQINTLGSEIYLVEHQYYFTVLDIVKAFTMLNVNLGGANGPLWTLPIEWFFYIAAMGVFAALWAKSLKNKVLWIVFAALPLLLLTRQIGFWTFANYIVIWSLGSLICFKLSWFREKLKHLLIISVGLIFIYTLSLGGSKLIVSQASSLEWFYIQLCMSLLSVFLVLRIYLGRFWSWVSRFSYTLYIVHFPMQLFVFGLVHEYFAYDSGLRILAIILTQLTVLGVSFTSAKIFENKKLFRRFIVKNV